MFLMAIGCASARTPQGSVRRVTEPANEVLRDASVMDAVDAAMGVDADEVVVSDVSVGAPVVPVRMYRGRSEDEWIRLMSERAVQRVIERDRSTMYVWHLDLGEGVEISFQPEQEHLETFWRREIASWHLARLLGVEHRAPPVVGKRIPATALGRSGRRTGIVIGRDGMVVGSAAVWVPVLRNVHMHEATAREVWARWMNPAFPLPEDAAERERARQVSEVLVFDYLAANYDRWNCCNIAADEHNNLVFRDNDAGWVSSVINRLGSPGFVRRMPRYLYASLQTATAEALRASIAHDPEGARGHLIPDGAYVGYERRRLALLASVRRAVARYSEAVVFPWP
jgi:hypothetical protein